ncbi:MAG: hypothetical protein J2P54_18070, partial [Bradyrhizobiaceae bacterium]|nr:hypothetical protein [Bradyrhizobiaceae bacterium]
AAEAGVAARGDVAMDGATRRGGGVIRPLRKRRSRRPRRWGLLCFALAPEAALAGFGIAWN